MSIAGGVCVWSQGLPPTEDGDVDEQELGGAEVEAPDLDMTDGTRPADEEEVTNLGGPGFSCCAPDASGKREAMEPFTIC